MAACVAIAFPLSAASCQQQRDVESAANIPKVEINSADVGEQTSSRKGRASPVDGAVQRFKSLGAKYAKGLTADGDVTTLDSEHPLLVSMFPGRCYAVVALEKEGDPAVTLTSPPLYTQRAGPALAYSDPSGHVSAIGAKPARPICPNAPIPLVYRLSTSRTSPVSVQIFSTKKR